MQLRVRAIRPLTADIRAFELVDPSGGELPAFEAGAHLKVRVMPHAGARSTRAYSLVGDPQQRQHYEIAVLNQRGGQGGSAWMHEAVQVGDLLDIDGPHNAFALAPHADRSVLLAGGIGITPLLCMARELVRRPGAVELHYFGRSPEGMAYRAELQALRGLALHEYTGLDADASVAAMRRCVDRAGAADQLYICGPAAMLDAAIDTAARLGWPSQQVHFERFAASAGVVANEAFTVELRSSGRRFQVGRDQTLLDALLAQRVDVAHDCRAGICGSCLVPVADGQLLHRDTFLTAEDRAGGDLMCACVSRASGLLSLDL